MVWITLQREETFNWAIPNPIATADASVMALGV